MNIFLHIVQNKLVRKMLKFIFLTIELDRDLDQTLDKEFLGNM